MLAETIAGNKACAGGGLYIKFHHLAVRNTVSVYAFIVDNNEMLPHSGIHTMGGGMNVEFDTDQATSTTTNIVLMNGVMFIQNNTRDGVGG